MSRGYGVGLLVLALTACTSQHAEPAVGWSIYAPADEAGPGAEGFVRYIISGPTSAVAKFEADAVTHGWSVETRARGEGDVVFVQFRTPLNFTGEAFLDRYLVQRPCSVNIAPVIVKTENK